LHHALPGARADQVKLIRQAICRHAKANGSIDNLSTVSPNRVRYGFDLTNVTVNGRTIRVIVTGVKSTRGVTWALEVKQYSPQ
jgi:hypothetical protein